MAAPLSGPDRPGPAGPGDRFAALRVTLGRTEVRRCFLLPLCVSAGSFVLAAAFAPSIDSVQEAGRFSSFFSTSAQVIVTLLVALALEARSLPFRELNARRLIVAGTLSYVTVGAVAAVLALNPTLCDCAYRLLFALTMAAGAGALFSVLAISYLVLEAETQERRNKDTLPPNPPDPGTGSTRG